MTKVTLFYKVPPNCNSPGVSTYSQLYSDCHCTQIAGYYFVEKRKNTVDVSNNIYNTNITLYFGERIIQYIYVKKNNNPINAPILFDNLWNGESKIGYVNRKVLSDGITRKITITLQSACSC